MVGIFAYGCRGPPGLGRRLFRPATAARWSGPTLSRGGLLGRWGWGAGPTLNAVFSGSDARQARDYGPREVFYAGIAFDRTAKIMAEHLEQTKETDFMVSLYVNAALAAEPPDS